MPPFAENRCYICLELFRCLQFDTGLCYASTVRAGYGDNEVLDADAFIYCGHVAQAVCNVAADGRDAAVALNLTQGR